MTFAIRLFCQLLFLGIVAWLAAAVLLGCAAYLFPQQVLTVDSGTVHADALVVLGGGPDDRPQRTAQLFAQGAAPRILVSGYGDCQLFTQILEKRGVPATAIQQEPESKSTFENAKFSVPLLRQMGAHRIIIVTSWYHSRRALMCFEHFAPDLQFYSRPSYHGYQPWDWNRRSIANALRVECLKFPYYWICHGVWPLSWK